MTNEDEVQDAKAQAAEYVAERAETWDPGAEPETVEKNLREGFAEAGVDVDDAETERVAEGVHDEKEPDVDPGSVS